MSSLLHLCRCLFQFRAHERGTVAVIFSLAVIPMLGLFGAAVDYGSLSQSKDKVDMIADSAILAAVSKAAMSDTASAAQNMATDSFNAQKKTLPKSLSISSLSVTVTENVVKRVAVIKYTATQPTVFLGIVGFKTMSFSGTATAEVSLAPNIDFHLLLDNSPSMGIGATQADINKLLTNPKKSCAFACHAVPPHSTDAPEENNYTWAVQNNVTLRIDVLRSAVQALMDKATAIRSKPDQFRLAIHSFGNECASPGLTTIAGLSNDLNGLRNAASGLQLMTVMAYGIVCTDFIKMFRSVNTLISDPGDGSSAQKPQKVLFFVSDGVHDSAPVDSVLGCSGQIGAGRCHEPINLSLCRMIKDRGIRIAVLYTTYLPLPTDGWYNGMIAPFQPKIPSHMQDCASPGLYYEVSPNQGISAAMNALFQKTVLQAKLVR